MLGAIIGDIAGSRFEWNNIKNKEFRFLHRRCHVTDDSVMSLAIAKAILDCDDRESELSSAAVKWMQTLGRRYPRAGYGGRFYDWIQTKDPKPYNSYGNGAAMRVSACGFAAATLEEAKNMACKVTEVSHNHSESIKAAEAVASTIFMAMHGSSMEEIKDYISANYYVIDFTLDSIRDTYTFDVSCQGSVPQAFAAFFEASDYEDAIRNAISIGGDSDTIAAIAGSMAEAYFGIPESLRERGMEYLRDDLKEILVEFENMYPGKIA